MLSKITCYIKNNRPVLIFVYWPIHILWFAILQKVTMGRDPFPVSCAADRFIPFSEWFVLPYMLWYVQIIAVSLYLYLCDKEVFARLYIYLFSGLVFCMTLCSIVPMYFDRSGIVMYPRDNFLTDCVKLLQGIDPPTTILPSMHVYVTAGLHLALRSSNGLRRRKAALCASGFYTLSVCLATVFTKQHSVLDVSAALPLCAVMYFAAFRPDYKRLFGLLRIERKSG